MEAKTIREIKSKLAEMKKKIVDQAIKDGVDVDSPAFKKKIKTLEKKVVERLINKLGISLEEYKNIELMIKSDEKNLSLNKRIDSLEDKVSAISKKEVS